MMGGRPWGVRCLAANTFNTHIGLRRAAPSRLQGAGLHTVWGRRLVERQEHRRARLSQCKEGPN